MIEAIIVILLLLGILNASHLNWQYRKYKSVGRPMTCPIGGKSGEVVSAKYGMTFGVKNEIWGILYYVFSLVALAVFFYHPQFADIAKFTLIGAASGSVVFSTYLLYVQFVILREQCSWCIVASGINYLVFFGELNIFFF